MGRDDGLRTELLHEHGHARALALYLDGADPRDVARARAVAGLTPDDDPVNAHRAGLACSVASFTAWAITAGHRRAVALGDLGEVQCHQLARGGLGRVQLADVAARCHRRADRTHRRRRADAVAEFAVGERAVVVDERRAFRVACIAFEQKLREVELLGWCCHGVCCCVCHVCLLVPCGFLFELG